MAAHRAYYPAYEFWTDSLEPEFQLFINPLIDNLSRKIKMVDILTFVQENLEFPLSNLFVDGVTITGTGTEDDPFTASGAGDNIYTVDGTLTGNRTLVGGGTNSLTFDGLTEFNIEAYYIELTTQPPLNVNLTEILGRNALNGEVEYLTPSDIYSDEDAQDAIGTILTDTDTINFTYNDGTPSIIADIKYQMSITSDTSGLKFVNDVLAPATGLSRTTRFYYGTDYNGVKGYHKQFLQFDGGTVWSPYMSDYELTNKLNFAGSAGWILGTAAFNAIPGTGTGILGNSNIFGNNNAFYTTNMNYSNIVGYDNFNAVGSNPLWHNTIFGYGNVGAGSSAGGLMQYNTLIGTVNLTGTSLGNVSHCVAVGSSNLTNMRGDYSVGIGYEALRGASGSNGVENIGVGRLNAGLLSTGANNIFIGKGLGIALTTGSRNIFLGKNAGTTLTTGNDCIFLGDGATGTATGNYQLVIGALTGAGQGTWLSPLFQSAVAYDYNMSYNPTSGHVTHYLNAGKYNPTITGDGTNTLNKAFFIRNGNFVHCIVSFQSNQSASIGGNANTRIALPISSALVSQYDLTGICVTQNSNQTALCDSISVFYDGVNQVCNIRFGSVAAGWSGSENVTVSFMYEIK